MRNALVRQLEVSYENTVIHASLRDQKEWFIVVKKCVRFTRTFSIR